jgi:hypothetical protein
MIDRLRDNIKIERRGKMRDILVYALAVALCLAPGIPVAIAQDDTSSGSTGRAALRASYKEERTADKQAIESQKAAIKEQATAAHQEEGALKEQIRAAEQSGDIETAKNLREQLKSVHQQNKQERQQSRQAIGEAKKEMRQDKREAIKKTILPHRGDRDNNPPGPKGGPGTNWENPPGPKGGPGASPNKRPKK